MESAVIAYKFLARGGRGPLSGFAWPLPHGGAAGAWVETDGPLAQCARGVHVCRASELANWLSDELWQAEIDGDRLEGIDCLVVRRARLVRPIAAWSAGGAERFAEACIAHAAEIAGPAPDAELAGYLDDARVATQYGYPATAAFCAALVAGKRHEPARPERGFARERVWQSEWIARELIAA
jgi:hypothetical protein